MEVGVRLESGGIELTAAFGDEGAEFVEGCDMPVDDRLIDERPEPLGRLEFGRVGRQKDEANPIGDDQVFGTMPARIVEHEDDAALATRAGLAREGGEQFGEEGLREAAAKVPDRLTAGRLHEGRDVQPLITVMAKGDGLLADGGPDAAPERLQAEAMLVLSPDLDRSVRMRGCGLRDRFVQLFLSAARSSGVAALG